MIKERIVLMALILFGTGIKIFAQLSIEGELRPRLEFRDGFRQLPDNSTEPSFFVSQRSRLLLNYSNEKISTKVTFQDVRIWGDEKLRSDVPSTAVHEAWAQLKLTKELSLRVGRQEISYDNERLFSKNNWTQQGTAHDAAILILRNNGWEADLGGAFNQAKDNLFGTNYSDKDTILKFNYKTLNFIWIKKQLNKNFGFSLLGIMDGLQKEGTTNTTYLRGTYGLMLYYNFNKLSIAARGFLQNGSLSTGKDINKDYAIKRIGINANYFNADISYMLNKKTTILFGFENISGQNSKDLNEYNAFNTLYGTNHKFNGNMEYFTGAPKGNKYAGLFNPYFNIIYQLNSRISLRGDFHYFSLNNNYYYIKGVQNPASYKYLGTEGDLSCKYDFSEDASILFGYSFMVADNGMTYIVAGDRKRLGNWAFVQLTVKPVFFKYSK